MIGLVACSAKKLARAAPARELYSSPLFRKSLRHAEARCSTVYVLSALHGLVDLGQVLEPYDFRLGGKPERKRWGARVASSLIHDHGRDADYLILAGIDYATPLATALRTHDGHRNGRWRGVDDDRIHRPLAGMSVGARLRWLNEQNAALAARSEEQR